MMAGRMNWRLRVDKNYSLDSEKIISSVLTLFICNKGSQKLIFLLKTPHVLLCSLRMPSPTNQIKVISILHKKCGKSISRNSL